MSKFTRKPRHRCKRYASLNTAQAILAVAEESCASSGVTNLKLTDIACSLGIESPSIYKYYNGLNGVIAALGEVSLHAEITTFDDIDKLSFPQAIKLQAERSFELYFSRPGLARFTLLDLAIPGGVHDFQGNSNSALIKKLFKLEEQLLNKGIENNQIQSMSLTTFISARLGPALMTFSLIHLGKSSISKSKLDLLKKEYIQTVMRILIIE